jgi:hypothetical protein
MVPPRTVGNRANATQQTRPAEASSHSHSR